MKDPEYYARPGLYLDTDDHERLVAEDDARCAECGVALSPSEAEDSYDLTYRAGEGGGGRMLCGYHLDAYLQMRGER